MSGNHLMRANSVLTALALLVVTSCTRQAEKPEDPTAAAAEQALKSHINKLAGTGVGNIRHLKVVDPGGKDLPCGKGLFKRTYSLSGDKNDPEKDDLSLNAVDLTNAMYGRLITQVAKYDLTRFEGGKPEKSMHNNQTRTNITITATDKRQVTVQGSTDCLRSG